MSSKDGVLEVLDWEMLGEAIPELVSIHDRKFNIVWANQRFFNKFGVQGEELIGEKCYQVVHSSDAPYSSCPHRRAMETDEVEVEEVVIGEQVYLISCSPISIQGETVGSVHTAKDITRRRQAEEELKRYAQNLENSNKLKDLFMDIISHDILNQAGVIRGLSDLMLDEDPHNLDLQMIKMRTNKLIEIVDSAGKLAKLESGEGLKMETLDLCEVIKRAVGDVRHLIDAAGMEVENRVRGPLHIKANPVVEEVFINSLSNAAKYASDGKRVVIEAREGKGRVKVVVKDYGPGIPDEAKESIFGRFRRRNKEGVRGTGLGLAIAKRIVVIHSGKIWVEDTPQGGATFVVELPKSQEC